MWGIKAKPDMKNEMQRRKSQRVDILDLLQKGEVTTVDLQGRAFNYTMRVSELRKKGYVITATYESPGVYRYTLIGNKDDDTSVSVID